MLLQQRVRVGKLEKVRFADRMLPHIHGRDPSSWKSTDPWCALWCHRWAVSPWKNLRGCPPHGRGRGRWDLTWQLRVPSHCHRTRPSEKTKWARWRTRIANPWQLGGGDQRQGHRRDRRRFNQSGWGWMMVARTTSVFPLRGRDDVAQRQ